MRTIINAMLLYIVLTAFSTMGFAFQVPHVDKYVNDHAHMFSYTEISKLEGKLASIEANTSVQIVILTINSLNGAILEDASIMTANSLGIGQSNKNNGLLIFISKQDRAIRIEVGSGLESIMTDARMGRVIDHIIVPNFKIGEYDYGIDSAVNIIHGYITATSNDLAVTADIAAKENTKLPYKVNASKRFSIYLIILTSMIAIAIINLIIAKKMLGKLVMMVDEKILAQKGSSYYDYFPNQTKGKHSSKRLRKARKIKCDYYLVTHPKSSTATTFEQNPSPAVFTHADEKIITTIQDRLKLLLFFYKTKVWIHTLTIIILTFEIWAYEPSIMLPVFLAIGYFLGIFIFLNERIIKYLPYTPEQTRLNFRFNSRSRSSSFGGFSGGNNFRGSGGSSFSGGGGSFKGGGASGRW